MQIAPEPSLPTTPAILCASWIAPMDAPPIRDAAVAIVNGRIVIVGAADEVRARHPDFHVIDLPGLILVPGLVNAHTHLELSDCKCPTLPTGGFMEWIQLLMRQTRVDESQLPGLVSRAIAAGVKQCLNFGVTAVGDISRQCHLSRPLLKKSPLRVVSYGEIQAMAQRRNLLESRLAIATDPRDASDRLTIGISPHAPYSVEPDGYQRCLEIAEQHSLPMATHLAETPYEADFLNQHTGPFRELWKWLAAWDDAVPFFDGTTVQYAHSLGLLDHPTLLAHVNYCDDGDLDLLAGGCASVVYCPRTHQYFQHPPHRWREMLAQGINVAIGTDSCASSPDLNLLDDLRLIRKIAPDVRADVLWEMATIRGAQAINLQNEIGTLTAGKRADLIAFEARGDNPLQSILDQNLTKKHLWIEGKLVPA